MPLITLPVVDIEINIPDLVVNEITLKRKAKLFTMTYNQVVRSLTLSWIVSYPDLKGIKGLSSYSKESIADNTTMVDATSGAIIIPTQVPQVDEKGDPVLDSDGNQVTESEIVYDGDWTGQYDFFNYIAENQPLKVHDMIRQYGLAADWSK